jgi:membrane glycosyltransferase
MWVFIGTMGVLLGPKLLAWIALVLRPEDRRGCGGVVLSFLSMLVETLLTGLLAPVAMLFQSGAVVTILAGRDGGWAPQRRDDDAQGGGLSFRTTLRHYLPHTLTGLGLGLVSWLVSVPLLLWMSPVVIGLSLAAPLAALTGKRSAGRALRRVGLLQTPEEVHPPAVLLDVLRLQPTLLQPEMRAFERLMADPALLAAHRAMLPPPRRRHEAFDPALLVGLAKLMEMEAIGDTAQLTRAEQAAVLADADGLRQVETLARLPARGASAA